MNRLMKKSILFLIMISINSFGQNLDCQELIEYRDNELVVLYDKAVSAYQLNAEALKDIEKYRKELQDDNSWAASNTVALVVTVKLLCDAFNDIMAIGSPQGKVLGLARQFHGKAISNNSVKFFDALGKGKNNLSLLISENVEYEMFKMALSELGQVGNATAFFLNLRDNVESLDDHQNLRKELRLQLLQFDKASAAYSSKLNETFEKVDLLNEYKEYIDEYLNQNCSLPNCNWIYDLRGSVYIGTRCGKSTSVEVTFTNNLGHNLRTFASFQKPDGSWGKWQYDGSFGEGIKPGGEVKWYTCDGTGEVKILAIVPSKLKCKLPDPNN